MLCLDARRPAKSCGSTSTSGQVHGQSYPAGPRCTPTIDGDRLYALGAEGDLCCLDAKTGKQVWAKNLPKEYSAPSPLWGWCGHPLVYKDTLVTTVGGEGSTVVAFDKATGKEVWKSLSAKEIGYAPPTLIDVKGAEQLVIWHGEAVVGLDPSTGKKQWSVPLAPKYAMSIMAARKSGDVLYAGAVFGSAVGVKLTAVDKAEEVWRGPATMKGKGLYPMNMTPFVEDGIMYGADQPGMFRAVEVATGKQLWESWQPVTGKDESAPVYCGTAFVVKNGKHFWLFTEKGDLVIAKMTPEKYEEVGRAHVIEPTGTYAGRKVVWTHPAFANRTAYIRNDKEVVAVSLAKE